MTLDVNCCSNRGVPEQDIS